MLTKITDTLWVDLDKLIIIGQHFEASMERYGFFQFINKEDYYSLSNSQFQALIQKYENYIYGNAEAYRDKIFK